MVEGGKKLISEEEKRLRDDLKALMRFYQSKENQHTNFLVGIMLGGFWVFSKSETPDYGSLLLFLGVLFSLGLGLLCGQKKWTHTFCKLGLFIGVLVLFIFVTINSSNYKEATEILDILKNLINVEIVLILAAFLVYFALRRAYWERRVVIAQAFLGMDASCAEKLSSPNGNIFGQSYNDAVNERAGAGAANLINSELSRQFQKKSDMRDREKQWPASIVFWLGFRVRQRQLFKDI